MIKVLRDRSLWVVVLASCFLFNANNALSYHFPWDQGHDTTDYPDPDNPGPCEGPNCDPCKGTGSPVYIATGHFIWTEADLSMAGRPGLSLARTYNSNDPRAGIFGNGWSSDCDLHMSRISSIETDVNGDETETQQLILTAANGKRYEYKQDSSGTFQAPLGRSDTVSESEDANGAQLISLESQGGYKHLFNEKSQLVGRTEPNGGTISYGYNTTGQLTSLSDDAGRSIDLSYNAQGLVSVVADHTGRQWLYSYDSSGNLTQVTDPLGGSMTYEYQEYIPSGDSQIYNQLTKITDASGVVVTEVVYQQDKVSSYTVGSNRYTYQYSEANRRVTKTDSLNSSWIYEYSVDQVVTQKTDPLGNAQVYDYDADGNLIRYTDAAGQFWGSTFDDQRRVLTHSSPLGLTKTFEYDTDFKWPERSISALGRLTSTVYNDLGNAIQVTNANGDVVAMSYDENGNLVQIDDALGNQTNMTYNQYGLVATSTDALGRTNQFGYDSIGRVTSLTSGAGNTVTFSYDGLDRVTAVTDPSQRVTSYTYDAAGRKLTHTDPANKTTQFEHDVHGRVVRRIYPDTRAIQYTYRADNLPQSILRPDNTSVAYQFDSAKLLTSLNVDGALTNYSYTPRYEVASIDNESGSIAYTYDDDGRLVGENINGLELAYSYNDDNERVRFVFEGRTLNYTRDNLGRVTSVNTPEGDYTFAFDAHGKRISTSLPNGNQVSYGYDAGEQLTDLTHTGIFNASYQYQYDDNGILNQVSGAEDWTYTYDEDVQLVGATTDVGTYTYSYDLAGNITNDQRQYDDNHRLLQSSEWTLSYDQRGNVTEKLHNTGLRVAYTWNSRSQLIQVDRFLIGSVVADSTTSYTYGPMGRRFSRTEDGVETRYVYDGNNRIATLDSAGNVEGHYTFGPTIDEPLGASFSTGSQRYFHADNRGSIVALSDDAGVTDQYRYDVWGQTISHSGTSQNDFRYTGREFEAEDLYYYRARYYDPTLQRYLSEDPMGFAGGDHNLYRYVGNNPANFTDPSGNWAFLIPVVWAGIELALAVYDTYELYETLTDPCVGTTQKLVDSGLFLVGFVAPGGGYTKADDAARYADNLADAAKRNPCGCFDADTKVLTDNGYKAISEIEVGDLVVAKNEESGEVSNKPVNELLRYENRAFYSLVLIGPEGIETALDVTDDHPFWVDSVGWVESDQLQSGMLVQDLEGDLHGVKSMLPTGVVGKSYNFEVSDFHTYFVGSENIWVHNCPNVPKPPTGRGSVPPADRDPKRNFTPNERADKRAEQNNQCAQCGDSIEHSNSHGHHVERHADGGLTVPENHVEVCIPCHKDLHSGNN